METHPLSAGRTAVVFDVVIRYIDEEHAAAYPDFTDRALCLSDWTRGACAGMDAIRPLVLDDARILIFHPDEGDQVQIALEAAKLRVGRVDSRESSRGKFVDPVWLSRQGDEDRNFLLAIAQNRQGYILAAGITERARLIALVAAALPRVRIAVALASRGAAAAFRLSLGRRTGEPIGLDLDGNTRMYRRITVGSLASVRCSGGQFVFFVEGGQALTRHGEDALLACRDDRRYGFFDPGEAFSPRSMGRIAEAFGRAIYDVPPREGRRATVHVARVSVPPGAGPAIGTNAFERKRAAFWRNRPRNLAIAAIARAVVARDIPALTAYGLSPSLAGGLVGDGPRPRRVAVLVEVPEHGRQLLDLLKGWTLRQGRPDPEADSPPDDSLDRSIATLVHLSGHGFPDVEVLIRADGGRGGLDLRGFPGRRADTRDGKAYVVDLDDRVDPRAIRDAADRMSSCAARGWSIGGD